MEELPRIRSERLEREILSPRAALSAQSRGRAREEAECGIRTAFQRDRDRVIHSKAFRRLKHKTQVFLSPEGDHYRTRLTHTLEVAQIGRTIARALRLNEDLTEAIALGHDLGHTPFGHAGERALNELGDGGFRHYLQSVRVCEKIEKKGRGLNLTAEVLDGIACHTGGREAFTLEGRIIRLADKIAYINHDIEDAVSAGVLTDTDIPKALRDVFGESKSQRINTMVLSVIENSDDTIRMDEPTAAAFEEMHRFLYKEVYYNPVAKAEEGKVDGIIRGLYIFFEAHPDRLPEEYKTIAQADGLSTAIKDYIAGMTDPYALQTYSDIYIPKSWNI
ncbi:MAG: deoxyguanosinetriphosphate triphosphohydrolase [Candidatus Howiella sp.]|jgi:dGTPase